MRFRSQQVDPAAHECIKFFPSIPPRRGDEILVDGQRCRVTKCVVDWEGYDWRIRTLKVQRMAVSGDKEAQQ